MPTYSPAHPESVFTYGAPRLKFGSGAADEIGYGLARTGSERALVDGTMKQQRLLATAPRDVTEDDVAGIFRRSLHLW